MSQDLKPCPFCGAPAKELRNNGARSATCSGSFQCPGTDVIVPVKAWNRRAEGAPAAEGFDIRASIERIGRAHSDAYNQNIGHNTVVAIEAELRAALSPPAAEGKEDLRTVLRNALSDYHTSKLNLIDHLASDPGVIAALSHRAPAAEPVAWRWRPRQDPGYGWCVGVIPPAASPERWEIEPLYASPPPGGEG